MFCHNEPHLWNHLCIMTRAKTFLSMNGISGSQNFLPPSGSLNSVATSPQARPPPDQGTDCENPPRSSVLSAWLVLGVASQLGHRPSCECAGPVGSLRSSALLNHKHLSCITTFTSTTSSSNCTWSISTVFWIIGICLCTTGSSPRTAHGISSVFLIFWMVGICLCVTTECLCEHYGELALCGTSRISHRFVDGLRLWRQHCRLNFWGDAVLTLCHH